MFKQYLLGFGVICDTFLPFLEISIDFRSWSQIKPTSNAYQKNFPDMTRKV